VPEQTAQGSAKMPTGGNARRRQMPNGAKCLRARNAERRRTVQERRRLAPSGISRRLAFRVVWHFALSRHFAPFGIQRPPILHPSVSHVTPGQWVTYEDNLETQW